MSRPFAGLALLSTLAACAPSSATCPATPTAGQVPSASETPVPSTPPPALAATSTYEKPPANILEVLHAPTAPDPYIAPTRDAMLLVSWVEYPSITEVAEPYLRLAGVRLEPKTRRKHDTDGGYGVVPCVREYSLLRVADGVTTPVKLPQGCIDGPTWSADGKHFAFENAVGDGTELWVGDGATAEVHRIEGARLNPMFGAQVQWLSDQSTLLVKLVPEGQGAPPPAPTTPPGPSVQETDGKKGTSSTYETRDTLTSAHDEELFDYYSVSQLALVDVAKGTITRIGKTGPYTDADAAPDGQHILVETLTKPYSYVTTYERFAHEETVWDRSGNPVKTLASLPLADRVPVRGVPTGPRSFSWRQNEPATLTWSEALDGGDWNTKVPARDKVMMSKAPFSAAPVEIARTEQRFSGFMWGEEHSFALLYEYDANRHWRRAFSIDVDAAAPKPNLLWDLSTDEHYADPGAPVTRTLPHGERVIREEGGAIFLRGGGSSPDGDRPFLDRFELATKKATRLFRSEKTALETFVGFTDLSGKSFFTWHQSPTDPPNLFLRTLTDAVPSAPAGESTMSSTTKAVTHIPDPTPAVRGIKKRLIKYKRKDGVDLSFTLYTPPGYQEGTRLPTILNAYPLDYADASKAGQVTGSEQTFTRLRQYRLLLLAGYALIDNASFPIVGDPKKAYDTYLEQLVSDAKAAVEEGVKLGVVDPDRIGITGHSHGALMTVNLLAHSDLFRAGVATSGSYNKTLTPFGFQNERRSVWEAPKVYQEVSPFFFADKIKLPVLIMHGDEDANPGTTPLQATKLFEAIRGNGGTARLVMLPHEPHWYTAMESNEELIAEMVHWFDKYVKNAAPKESGKEMAKPEGKH